MSRYEPKFPYEKIKKTDKVVIYGAGQTGRALLRQQRMFNFCDVLYLVDRNFAEFPLFWKNKYKIECKSPMALKTDNFDFCIAACKNKVQKDMLADIEKLGVPSQKIIQIDCDDIVDYTILSEGDDGSGLNALSYSQKGQDMVLLNLFRTLGLDKPSYIDVGAHHPYDISNTALLNMLGSRGINVEANPNLIGDFKKYRSDDINLNIGVGTQKGAMTFFMFDELAGINTFSFENAQSNISKNPNLRIQFTKELPVVTLQEIIDTYNNGIWPDLLDIDIEGLDNDILNSLEFNGKGPIAICVESSDKKMMREKGYEVYAFMGDIIYIRKDIHDRLFSL
jgi:FkbM family methyltransferase